MGHRFITKGHCVHINKNYIYIFVFWSKKLGASL